MNNPKRLIFLHIGKTGGQSFQKWIDPSIRTKTFEYNATSCHENSTAIVAKSAESSIIHIHGPSKGFASHFESHQWNELLLDSARFCIIRDPIAKFESDFRYAFQTKSPHEIPHVHSFWVQSRIPFKPSVTDYFSQNKINRLDINDWVQLVYDHFLSSNSVDSDEHFSYVGSAETLSIRNLAKYNLLTLTLELCRK